MDLTGQVALVTGGSRGLGRAFSEALVAAGAQVAITGRSADELNQTAAELSTPDQRVLPLVADVIDAAGIPQVIATTEQQLGPITLLINNAGQFRAFGGIASVDAAAWWNEVEVNLRGPFLYTQAVLPSMQTRHAGRIINVASNAGLGPMLQASAYGVSKTALIRFSEILAQETAADRIRVFAIHPGTVRTPMNAYVHDSADVAQRAPRMQRWFQNLYAAGRDNPIEQSVELVLRLAAGDADGLSGYFLSVEDDLDALIQQQNDQTPADYRTLRLVR